MDGSNIVRISCINCDYAAAIFPLRELNITNMIEPPATCSNCGQNNALQIEQIKSITSDCYIMGSNPV